ncbi:uncharacterized protein LOC125863741 [Solanum stenotomum]|uniref:uncharacterized protein LOC125863741 n=1 Tax=Solanum stenotomum TaxID=172797 RepID=UPI0020D045C1|nr:uncharacterized protein LOC125863741 [Solanum stenotomum]
MEPFSDNAHIQSAKNQLAMEHGVSNCNGKIWLFWNMDIDCVILEEDEQQITCEFKHNEIQNHFTITFVYAKCKDHLRRPLWDRMLHQSADIVRPWCSVGDYNVITSIEEKLGGVPYNMRKSLEFIAVIEACGLIDLGFSGQKFTWSNNRGIQQRVWKRLDRALVNDAWLEKMPQTTITHLPSVGSDHYPLLMEMNAREDDHIKYFKFLNCWTDQPNFLETVKACWDRNVEGNNMWKFHQKMKRLSNTLSNWSREEFGDIFAKVRDFEEKVKTMEEQLIQDPSEDNRSTLHELNARYIKFLKIEDSILKQKTQLQWFKEGDCNTKYFHSLIRGRRRRLFIHKIIREDGEWIQGDEVIAEAACEHFQKIFTGDNKIIKEDVLDCIPQMVTQEQNEGLTAMPNLEELKEVVLSMNPNSAAGPDGMNGYFFQKCWHIIKHDLLGVVHAFFCGQMIPKYFSHSCIVLLPKVKNPNKLSEFRPISLSNFTSKIISKLVSSRLSPILPSLVSLNQSGFVKGRSISENNMLAQEIIHQIKKPNIGSNVIIKLDMAKAYDRVSWSYICLVLRRMGFDEVLIDMIWRIMANNWYSIIVNGKRHGFFQSTRGLKQGDPLSPALFILGAEVLSRSLNRLYNNPDYYGFFMEPNGPQVNHLSFADDIILFTSGRQKTLQLIMQTLQSYEQSSGQSVNTEKSHFMVHSSAFNSTKDRIKRITGFRQKEGPITYLGCPLFVGRPRIIYFSDLINKVLCRITGWQTKLLSYGGRAILVKHVLQSLPIHLLASVTPPVTVLRQIQSITADFFWGWRNEKKKYHWSSWKNLSFPYDEGGVGMRNLKDVCLAFQYKQWWIFRSKQTLWGDFLKAKYCQRSNPIIKKWDTGESLTWKHLMHNKIQVEKHIQWKLNSGNCSFWWDNWLGIGPLAHYSTNSNRFNNTTVAEFRLNGQWNWNKLLQQAPNSQLASILSTELSNQQDLPDLAIWKPCTDGNFSCSSAWNEIREKRIKTNFNSFIWHKCIPFKISFLLWRLLRGKLPTNEKLTNFGIEPTSCFCCCNRSGLDTIEHIFNTGQFATYVWRSFADTAGISRDHSSITQLIIQWWSAKYNNEAHKLLLQATPLLICWNLWKNRCASKYGGKSSNISRVKYAIYKDNYKLMCTNFPQIKWPSNWKELIQLGESCSHDTKVTLVKWIKPPDSWVKINTDGSALNNPGRIGAGGILRDQMGAMLLAFATPLGEGTNNQAEIGAAFFGMTWVLQLGYKKVVLEVDSQLLVDWITQKTRPPWNISTQLQQLQELITQTHSFRCKHTYREANFVADSLSKQSHKLNYPQIYCNIQQLPREARAYYQLDIAEMDMNTSANRRRTEVKIDDGRVPPQGVQGDQAPLGGQENMVPVAPPVMTNG